MAALRFMSEIVMNDLAQLVFFIVLFLDSVRLNKLHIVLICNQFNLNKFFNDRIVIINDTFYCCKYSISLNSLTGYCSKCRYTP